MRRLPPEEEPGAPGAYGGAGSIDGTIPGKFWINLKPGFEHTRYDLPSLTHHEAIPGHVWQGEYANKLPLIRTLLSFNAYSEGWALYAEQLADELGVYQGFEIGRLGYLNSIAFRAAGWSSTPASTPSAGRASGRASSSSTLSATPAPARSTAIAAGRARPAATRWATRRSTASATRPRPRSGARFDLKAFNDAVVLGGNVPMDVLAKNVDDYIATARGLARHRRRLRRLGGFCADEGAHLLLQRLQRDRAHRQEGVVELALVEPRARASLPPPPAARGWLARRACRPAPGPAS